MLNHYDVIIIGAGAAGLICSIEAGKRGRRVLVLDHANKPGKKILMSGGGRCNFTNYLVEPNKFISHNPHFCKSALARYTQWDFIELVKKHQIPFHEKTLGQLFCDNKSKDILEMLSKECELAGVEIRLNTPVEKIKKTVSGFKLDKLECESLVIATGGLSIPTLGASPFGYQIAEQFGIKVWPTRAGLVPLTLHEQDKEKFAVLSGIGVDTLVESEQKTFREASLFTHRGLSGPAILQISSYWNPGETIKINFLPELNIEEFLQTAPAIKQLNTVLTKFLPARVIEVLLPANLATRKINSLTKAEIVEMIAHLQAREIKPNGTEGYRTAEVTLGGVDCDALSSKTMMAKEVEGLYFIGEVVDVSGWLGGYNFQWAWSSGWCAGQVV